MQYNIKIYDFIFKKIIERIINKLILIFLSYFIKNITILFY